VIIDRQVQVSSNQVVIKKQAVWLDFQMSLIDLMWFNDLQFSRISIQDLGELLLVFFQNVKRKS